MELIGMLAGNIIFYAIEFIAIVAVAVAGVFVGKNLRRIKDNKKQRNEADHE